MTRILKDYPPRDFPKPEGIVFREVDAETGLLALPSCPRRVLQAFRQGTEPAEYCDHDHSRPLALRPAFSVSNAAEEAFFDSGPDAGDEPAASEDTGEAGEDGLPQLPSDGELERRVLAGESGGY